VILLEEKRKRVFLFFDITKYEIYGKDFPVSSSYDFIPSFALTANSGGFMSLGSTLFKSGLVIVLLIECIPG